MDITVGAKTAQLGMSVIKTIYQNKQFCLISAQNQALLDTIQQYRMLCFVDRFYAAMMLLEEALNSSSTIIRQQNIHGAIERFSDVLTMQRPEEIAEHAYREIMVASYRGKFMCYSAFEDVSNMMWQFYTSGTRYPLETLKQFGKAYPQLFANEIFLSYQDEEIWCPHLLVKAKEVQPSEKDELVTSVASMLCNEYEWMQKSVHSQVQNKYLPSYIMRLLMDLGDYRTLLCAEIHISRAMERVQQLRKEAMFCEEWDTVIWLYSNQENVKKHFPKYARDVELVDTYIKRKASLLRYYEGGLKELAS